MSKLYTKTGDGGMTYLYDGSRRKKNSMFFDVLGDIDELSSHIGMLCAIISDLEVKNNWCTTISNFFKNDTSIGDYSSCDYSSCQDTQTKITILRDIQVKLLDIGSNIAVVDYTKKDKVPKLTEDDVKKLESLIDLYDIVPLKEFLITGVGKSDSQCHICRSCSRRAERSMWKLTEEVDVDENILKYMNRLSDFFFSFSRNLSNYKEIKVSDIKNMNKLSDC
jgi:cob(I)alamin adenosyltransferase